MAFYRTEGGRGWIHVNAGRRALSPPCRGDRLPGDDPKFGAKCGRISIALCDAVVGKDLAGKPTTCDMPICARHRTRGGTNIDYCPRHQHQAAPASKDAP